MNNCSYIIICNRIKKVNRNICIYNKYLSFFICVPEWDKLSHLETSPIGIFDLSFIFLYNTDRIYYIKEGNTMLNLVVFASGNGSTLQAIIDSIQKKDLNATIGLVVSDNPNAYALQRASKENIPTYVIQNKDFMEKDNELSEVLKKYSFDLIVLAGYLKKIGPKLLQNYKIINTHPSLLPKFGGKGMYGMHVHTAVIKSGESVSGVTLHWVNENYDEGNIIRQTKVKVTKEDTPESLAAKVQAAEKIQLVELLKDFSSGKLTIK